MKPRRFRKMLFVALCGGTLLQVGGCETLIGTLAFELISSLVLGALTGVAV